jgi:EAL domain-containing protein (putative c-di-GMP-specific phosphodiesterase class I)
MVKNALVKTELPPEGLTISFAERVVAVNYESFISVLSVLKKLGVGVTLDNVGSYYTATSLMRYSGICAANVDITIFTGIIDEFSKVYADNIMRLARENDVKIGVKSIENESQLVIAQGADRYQGSLYSDALEEEDFFKLVV